ncbi:MAG: glycosyltransferase family 39 protein [Methanobacteriaceae archaeon]|nr:glycosyltransferase family 39 protein [Methanobacteriaceae archaeon]
MSKKSILSSNLIAKNLNQIYLILILLGTFLVRLIPSRYLSIAGNDAYLHHDIVIRITEQGFGVISHNPLSLMGLSSYGYPPLYHIIGTILYEAFHSQLVFFILPPLLGVASVFVFYKLSHELFDNKNAELLSTLLFAFVPAFIVRTSVFIPESLGILLFISMAYFLVKYIKSIPGYENLDNFALKNFLKIFSGNYKYLMFALVIFTIYLFTHRGWVFMALVVLILMVTFLIPSFKKKPVTFSIVFILIGIGLLEFVTFVARFQQEPVTILGFPKWMGILQLVLGLYGLVIFIKSKNSIYKFLALWAIAFMVIGTYSFRFRDPYAAIPLTLMAGYVFAYILLPKINELSIFKSYKLFKRDFGGSLKIILLLILISIPIAQGVAITYSGVSQPTANEISAFKWIENETPLDAIFLTTKDDAYFLIGNTHRKDVALWKTVYEGFMGTAPSVDETVATQRDVDTMLGTAQASEAYYLLNKYNISYIYVSPGMYNLTSSNGLITYILYDTHFKTYFVSGDASVYKYIKNPTLNPPTTNLNSSSINNTEYKKSVEFIEQFWNGYSYSENGGDYLKDSLLDLEFGGINKGNYALNSQITILYTYMSQSSNADLNNRSQYLLNWLSYKQMDNGSFPTSIPPEEYTVGTMETIYPLMTVDNNTSNINENQTIVTRKGLDFVNSQTGKNYINISNVKPSSSSTLGPDYLSLKTYAQVSGMNPNGKEKIIANVLKSQKSDGSWTSQSYQNIEILKGLCLYYNSTQDKDVLNSIKKGSKWLMNNQNSQGRFTDDGSPTNYGLNHYADAVLVYQITGNTESVAKTLSYMANATLKDDITPLKSYLAIISNLSLIYGEDKAMEIANRMV